MDNFWTEPQHGALQIVPLLVVNGGAGNKRNNGTNK